MNNTVEKIMKEFDERFGTPRDENDGINSSNQEGRIAGCDDCFENIEIRKEHKSFLLSSLTRVVEEVINEAHELYFNMDYSKMEEYKQQLKSKYGITN